MDRIIKFLKRLDPKERTRVEETLKQIQAGDLQNLDVKKLKGRGGLFRVRLGSIRVVLAKEGGSIHVITIDRKGDDTYKKL